MADSQAYTHALHMGLDRGLARHRATKEAERQADPSPAWIGGVSAGTNCNRLSRTRVDRVLPPGSQEGALGETSPAASAARSDAASRLPLPRTLSRGNSASSFSTCSFRGPLAAGEAAYAAGPRPAAAERLATLGASVRRQKFDPSARACEARARQRQAAAEEWLGVERDRASALGVAWAQARARAAHVAESLAAERLQLLAMQATLVDFADRSPPPTANVDADSTGPGQSTDADAGTMSSASDQVAPNSNLGVTQDPVHEAHGTAAGPGGESQLPSADEDGGGAEDSRAGAGGRVLLNYFSSMATGTYAVSVETEEDKRQARLRLSLGLPEAGKGERRHAIRETIATYNSIHRAPGYVPIEALLNPSECQLSAESRFRRSLTHTHITTFGGGSICPHRRVRSRCIQCQAE